MLIYEKSVRMFKNIIEKEQNESEFKLCSLGSGGEGFESIAEAKASKSEDMHIYIVTNLQRLIILNV